MDMTPEGNMAPQRSWWSRNWKWAAPVGCLGLIGSCGCFTVALIALGFASAKSSTPYEQALSIAKSDSEVQATLGQPIESSFSMQSSIHMGDGQSTAEFSVPLHGSKTDGVLRIEATKSGKDWEYQVLQVEVPGQEPIDLTDKVNGNGGTRRELAPPTPDEPPPAVHDEDVPPPGHLQKDGKKDSPKNGEPKPDINL
jgi:hypothetical protein